MMDGEAPATNEATPTAPAPEAPAATENTAPDSGSQPEGFEPVEFNQEQLARVNRIYGNMKRYESKFKEQSEANQILAERLAEIQNNQTQVVQHLQAADFQDAESRLSQERQDAWNAGDVNRYNAANDKLIEIKAQKIAQETLNKNQPRQQPQRPQQGVNGDDIVQRAVASGDILSEDANVYKSWANETDAYGNLKRPWVNGSDMRNPAAASEGKAVFNNPAFANKPFAEKLREIDRRMGLATQQGNNQSVLPGGNLTPARKANNVKLSPDIERVAVMTKFAGPGKTDAEHIEAWKQSVAKRGARK